jgi:hypothetical protein
MSTHATAVAIDIAGFRFLEGSDARLIRDWDKGDATASFLHAARDGACQLFRMTITHCTQTIFTCKRKGGAAVGSVVAAMFQRIFPPVFSLRTASVHIAVCPSVGRCGPRAMRQRIKMGTYKMGKRDEWIAKYAEDLKTKCNMTPDMDLLTKVTIGYGPAIYNKDAQTVAGGQASELETVKNNFLIKKLGLKDGPELMEAICKVIEIYGKSERNKYRAVVYYMLTKHFGKEAIYG